MPILKLIVCRDYKQVERYLKNLNDHSRIPWEISLRNSSARFGDSFIQCKVISRLEDIRGTGMQLNSIEFLTTCNPEITSYIFSRLRSIHDWP